VASEDCYIANILGTQDCVDMAKSEGDPNAFHPHRFMFVRRLVLDESKVAPETRLFRTHTVPSVPLVRNDLKELFEKEGVTGPTFYPVGAEVAFTP
jgi:hypothetical protein